VLPSKVPSQYAAAFDKENTLKETVAWAVPCISGPGKGMPKNIFGALVATNEQPRNIFFVARKSGRPFAQLLDIDRCVIERDPRFLADNILIATEAGKRPRYSFVFSRPEKYIVDQVVEDLRVRISAPIWPIGKAASAPEPLKDETKELVEAGSNSDE